MPLRYRCTSPEDTQRMAEKNYNIAARFFSYSVLQKHLSSIMVNFFGEEVPDHMQKVLGYFAQKDSLE